MHPRPPPSSLLANASMLLLTGLWTYLRLVVFKDSFLPLTYVLPLLIGVWTRRLWHPWAMAALFCAFTVGRAMSLARDGTSFSLADQLFIGTAFGNIFIGAAIVHMLIRYRNRIDEQASVVLSQNAELEAQSEELMQQNEEIRTQSNELTQQNQEMNAQSEELARQNDKLQNANTRLAIREQMLEDLLRASRGSDETALDSLCQRILSILGAPAERVALLELEPGAGLKLSASASSPLAGEFIFPAQWPTTQSLASVVLREDRTAYVSDLTIQTDLVAPFAATDPVRSLLETPLRVEGETIGLIAVCSHEAAHWSEEQFQLLEWTAALCGQLVRGVRARRVLTARTQDLEAANRAKDDFLAMLSHELRTPLTPVLAAAGVLATDQRLPAEVREDLAMIRRNVGVQSRLIDDLLDLTRIERRKLELALLPCNPALLLRDAAAIAAPDLDAREQTLVVKSEVPDDWRLSGDPARLQQVLWNLLQNASKFSPPMSRITLHVHPKSGEASRLVIDVEDEGPGVPPDERERIFRPFEQIRNAQRVGRETGLGLGLAIARAIVELHGGSLEVGAGVSGRGARFSVELPATTTSLAEPVKTPSRESSFPVAPTGLSILLIEDHADTGRVISRLLKGAGHRVVHASTAADALSQFQSGAFNFVISDIGLPDESGLVLMKKLRERQPALTGICMTGYGTESDRQACREAGFREHLAKPVDVQRLLAAVNRASQSDTPRSSS